MNPQTFCDGARVIDAAARGKLCRHGDAGDAIGAKCIRRDDGDDGGINSAAEAEHGRFEITFVKIIAQA